MCADPASAWTLLTRSALVGAERVTAAALLPAPLDALGSDAAAPEQRLLHACALLSPWIRAGQEPTGETSSTSAVASIDEAPPVGPRAGDALRTILTTDLDALLPEWSAAARAAGRRPPDHLLPDLLERALDDRSAAAEAARGVLGTRGAWLARLNPAWSAAIPETIADPQSLWHTGTRAERGALFAALRATDPAAARSLLESTLADEEADALAASIAQMETGLTMADHDLLEKLLDARHKPVRAAAARLLARLPESARSARMATRLAARVTLVPEAKGFLKTRKAALEVSLPDKESAADAKALARDGIETQRKGKLGAKAMALAQIVSGTPLGWYRSTWDIEPAALIAAAARSEWREALLLGWTDAAVAQRDAEWTDALLAHHALEASSDAMDFNALRSLFMVLPPARRETLVTALIEKRPRDIHSAAILTLLESADHPWSPAFSRLVLNTIRTQYFAEPSSYLRNALPRFSLRLSPELASGAADGWPVDDERWSNTDRTLLERALTTLELRRSYLEELTR